MQIAFASSPTRAFARWCLALLGAAIGAGPAAAITPAEQLAAYTAAAGRPGQADAGQRFFAQKHGREWSCASCHGNPPTAIGQHASTGKSIAALAPAFNPRRFTDTAKTEKWFRRNCNDVLARECSAAEKADLLAYLLSIKP